MEHELLVLKGTRHGFVCFGFFIMFVVTRHVAKGGSEGADEPPFFSDQKKNGWQLRVQVRSCLYRRRPACTRSRSGILANPLPAFSLPAQSIFLNFARFSLFFTYRNAQHTAILRRCLGVKDSKTKWCSLGGALHQQNKPKFRYYAYNCKFKSKCAPLLSCKELSAPRQVLQGASLKTKQKKKKKSKL